MLIHAKYLRQIRHTADVLTTSADNSIYMYAVTKAWYAFLPTSDCIVYISIVNKTELIWLTTAQTESYFSVR